MDGTNGAKQATEEGWGTPFCLYSLVNFVLKNCRKIFVGGLSWETTKGKSLKVEDKLCYSFFAFFFCCIEVLHASFHHGDGSHVGGQLSIDLIQFCPPTWLPSSWYCLDMTSQLLLPYVYSTVESLRAHFEQFGEVLESVAMVESTSKKPR